MQCPECGYLITAPDKGCPQCRRRREAGAMPPGVLPVSIGPPRDTLEPEQTFFFQVPSPPRGDRVCPACSAAAEMTALNCLHCGYLFPAASPNSPPAPSPDRPYQGQTQPYQPYPPVQPPYPYLPGVIQMPPGTHSVAAAVILALLINGTGQMVNKQVTKGVVILLSAIVLGAVTLGAAWLVITLVALVDAVCIANRLNRGEPVRPWQWF